MLSKGYSETTLERSDAVAEDSMTVLDILRKEMVPDRDFLQGAVRHFVHELMDAELTALVGADRYKRSA